MDSRLSALCVMILESCCVVRGAVTGFISLASGLKNAPTSTLGCALTVQTTRYIGFVKVS